MAKDLFDEFGVSPQGSSGDLFDEFKIAPPKPVESSLTKAGKILRDPNGGILPAAGSLVDSALPTGGPDQGYLGDTAVDIARAPVTFSQTLAGLGNLATGGQGSKLLEAIGYDPKTAQAMLSEHYSDKRKGQMRDLANVSKQVGQEVKDASGALDTTTTALSGAGRIAGQMLANPGLIQEQVIQTLPDMLAGAGIVGGVGKSILAKGGEEALAAAGNKLSWLGHGIEGVQAAGQNAEQIRENEPENLAGQYLQVPAGVLTGLIGRGASKIPGFGDVQTAAQLALAGPKGAAQKLLASGSPAAQIVKGMISEGVFQELPQSAQEQIWQNLAEGKDWDADVLASGVQGMVTGSVMGGGMGGLSSMGNAKPEPVATPGELDTANAGLSSAIDQYDQLGAPNAGLLPAPDSVIVVPTQDGGTTTIDRRAGPISNAAADAVESGITASMLANNSLLQSYPDQGSAQAALDQRPDADRMKIVSHPRAKGRFAVVPKDRLTLQALDEAQARQQQLEEEDGNATQVDAAGDRATGADGSGSTGNAPAGSGLEGGTGSPAGASMAGSQQSESVGAASLADAALDELAPQPVQPMASMPGVQARNQLATARARFEAEARGARLIDEEASAANPEPSEAQVAAGNYKKGHVKIGPLDISVENPVGTTRKGQENGKAWQTTMQAHYGYVKRTEGADGDQVDVFIRSGTANDHSGPVYVIDQFNPKTQRFDEHKAMIGYGSAAEAAKAYDSHFTDGSGPKRRKAVVPMPAGEFRNWARSGDTSIPLSQAAQAADAAQTEIGQSTGKQSKSRRPGETDTQRVERMAAEANDRKRNREVAPAPATPTTAADVKTISEAIETDADNVVLHAAKDMPASGETKGLSRQYAQFVEQLARVFKKRVVFFSSDKNVDGFWIRGNTIYIGTGSTVSHLRILGHELTHVMRREAPAAYKSMFDAVKALATDAELTAHYKDYFGTELEGSLDQDYKGQPLRDFLAEEWMADLAGNRFGEPAFWTDMFNQIESQYGEQQQAKGIIARLRMALVSALNKIMSAVRGQKFAVDNRLAANLEDIRKAVAQGFAEYSTELKRGVKPADSAQPLMARGTADQTLPTRWPTSKKVTPSVNDDMITDLATLKQDQAQYAKAVAAVLEEPGMHSADIVAGDLDQQAEHVIGRMQSNLLWLFDQVPEAVRNRSKLWYDGARKIAEQWAGQYDITESQAAGALAVLSPQKDWFMNVTMAERVLDIIHTKMDHRFDEKMRAAAFSFLVKDAGADEARNTQAFEAVKGKTLAQVAKHHNLRELSVWIRAYDEAYHDPKHAIVTPEGGFVEDKTTVKGEATLRAWGDFTTPGKAASIYLDGSPENINKQLGGEHKVRNFYNNIYAPKDARFTTIDTHAVAADLLRPLAGADKPVAENFGKTGGTNVTGLSGTYALHYEAYRRAAEERDVLPREMQSITWEAVRGLFTEGFKGKKQNLTAVDDVWRQVDAGKLGVEAARKQIVEMAGGIEQPDWWNEGNAEYREVLRNTTYAKERNNFVGAKVTFEVAPDPRNAELKARWDALPAEAKLEISDKVTWKIAAKALASFNDDNMKGELHHQTGGWQADTNPSLSIWFNKRASGTKVNQFARMLGFALRQESMMRTSPRAFVGMDGNKVKPAGAIEIQRNPGDSIEDIYAKARTVLDKKGKPFVFGHTSTETSMVILHTDEAAIPFRELAGKIADALGEDYTVSTANIYVEFLNQGRNSYALRGKQADIAESSLRARSDQLRAETDVLFDQLVGNAKLSPARYDRPGSDGLDTGPGRRSSRRVGQGGWVGVTGVHFSKEQRPHLTGGFFGTGTKSEEVRRILEASDSRIKSRLYAYVDEGKGVRPEQGVGDHAHRVQLNNLYDLKGDPLQIRQKTRDANERESLILDAGFDGYYAEGVFGDQGVAILMGKASLQGVTPEYLGTGYRGGEAAPQAAAPVKADPLAGRKDLPMGRMTGAEWKKLVPEAKVEDGQSYYKDQLRFSPGRFYSQLERTFEQAPDKVFGSATQVKLWLAGNKAKFGIKDDEVQWTGINDWLELQGKAKVSKADVANYLAQNGVQVEEVEKGDAGYNEDDPQLPKGSGLRVITATDEATGYEVLAKNGRVIGNGETEADAIADAYSNEPEHWEGKSSTKYGLYALPGGENYRELLLTLPGGQPKEMDPARMDELRDKEDRTQAEEAELQQLYAAYEQKAAASKTYHSGHWDEANILAHVRFNDRTDTDGNKVLFIEELQSDWGQDGKKRGFDTQTKAPANPVSDAEWNAFHISMKAAAAKEIDRRTEGKLGADVAKGVVDSQPARQVAEWAGMIPEWEALVARRDADRAYKDRPAVVPAAPFVTDTKAWLSLGVKRMAAYAVENGYDKVAFINGEQSADRYDLSKKVDEIDYEPTSKGFSINVMAGGSNIKQGDFSTDELEDIVGKEVVQKMINGEGKGYGDPDLAGIKALKGVDLKVGGEGMKTFYDKIVPQTVSDVLKKLGGGKIETVGIEGEFSEDQKRAFNNAYGRGTRDDVERAKAAKRPVIQQLGFTITPALREKVSQGMPLFSIGRRFTDAVDRTIAKVDHAVDGLSNMPNQFDYLKDRYMALGKIARVDEITKEIREAFEKTDPANKKAVYTYLTTRGATSSAIPSAKIRAIAERIKKTIEYTGDQLVARGLLDQESRDHYRDQYLPRMYLRHMLSDQDHKVIGMGKKPSEMGYLKHRKDIPDEIREVVLGEIKDPAFLSANAIGRAMRDVSLLDWMGKISQNNDWVFPEIFANWQGKKVTAYWLRAEADRIELQIPHYDAAAKAKAEVRVADMRKLATQTLGGMSAIDHKKFKQIPDTMRYGLLRGMWIRNEIFDDIMGASQIVNADPTWFEDWFGFGGKGTKLTQWWKFTKVALNPPGQIRNFISNMVMLQLSGVGLHKLPFRLIQAARDISSNGKYWQVAKKYGVTESTFTAQELFRIKRDLVALESQQGKMNPLRWMMTAGAHFLEGVSDLYQFSEALGKTVKIIDEMEKGKSEAEAAIEAQKWLFDYSLVPQSVRIARNAPIGMPFLTYQIKVLPRLLEVAAKYPWRFLPWAGLLYGMQAAVASMFGVDDDDLDKLKKSLPQWLQDRGHTVFLPMRDQDGRIQVADVGYFFPWTYYSTAMKHAAEGNVKKVLVDDIFGMMSAPIIGAGAALTTNYDSFTKRPIYNETDPVGYQAAAIANYAYDLMAPPFLSSHGVVSPMGLVDTRYGGKLVQAETGQTNKFGDPRATEGQAIGSLVGANFYGMDPEHTRITNLQVMNRKSQEAERTLKQRLMDRGLSQEERTAVMQDYQSRMLELNQEMLKYAKESQVPDALKRSNR